MNKNMNAAPAFPDLNNTVPDGWANLSSGLAVPESAAAAFPSINKSLMTGMNWEMDYLFRKVQ